MTRVYILYTIEVVLLVALAILKAIYKTYASMSIGQLSENHKILVSVAVYIGISVAIMFITGVFLQSEQIQGRSACGGSIHALPWRAAGSLTHCERKTAD